MSAAVLPATKSPGGDNQGRQASAQAIANFSTKKQAANEAVRKLQLAAVAHFERSRFEDALQGFRKALARDSKADTLTKAELTYWMGLCASMLSFLEQAHQYFSEAYSLYVELGGVHLYTAIGAALNAADIQRRQLFFSPARGELLRESAVGIARAIDAYDRAKNPRGQGTAIVACATFSIFVHQRPSTGYVSLARGMLRLIQGNADITEGAAICYELIGLADYQLGNYEWAVPYALKALAIRQLLPVRTDGDRRVLSSCMARAAQALGRVGHGVRALTLMKAALRVHDDIPSNPAESLDMMEPRLLCDGHGNNLCLMHLVRSRLALIVAQGELQGFLGHDTAAEATFERVMRVAPRGSIREDLSRIIQKIRCEIEERKHALPDLI
jgi:tetratricopeptide (TPR) repeat protein